MTEPRAQRARRPRLAIIGSGISGLAAARVLQDDCDVTVFESDARIGGHIRPLPVDDGQGNQVYIDTGFTVFEGSSYPQLCRLIDELQITSEKVNFDVTLWDRMRGRHHRLRDFASLCGSVFAKEAGRDLGRFAAFLLRLERRPELFDTRSASLGELVSAQGYHPDLVEYLLLPALTVEWGFQRTEILAMSAEAALAMLRRTSVAGPESDFRRVVPSSKVYLDALIAGLRVQLRTRCEVHRVEERADSVEIASSEGLEQFDAALIAAQAHQALRLLARPTEAQRRVLGGLPYHHGIAIVHSDPEFVPDELARTGNLIAMHLRSGDAPLWATTWRFQHIDAARPVQVTIGDPRLLELGILDSRHIHHVIHHTHVALTPDYHALCPDPAALESGGRVFFSGSYFGAGGTHEHALGSALSASARIRATLWGAGRALDSTGSL
jgi:predicted NAD/FAD-binding protein